MKKILLLSVFLLMLPAKAQHSLPLPFTVSEDSLKYTKMDIKYWQYLDTGQDSVTFSQVTSPEFNGRFGTFKDDKGISVYTRHYFWLRYRLTNADAGSLTVAIAAKSQDMRFCIISAQGRVELRNGTGVPWSARQGLKRQQYIVYTLPAHKEVTIYVSCKESAFNRTMNPQLKNFNILVTKDISNQFPYSTNDILSVFASGFIAFAMIFNLLFFYINCERMYLVYSITLLFAAVASSSGIIQHEFFSNYPELGDKFDRIITMVLAVLMIQTIRFFFRVWDYYPRWDKILIWIPPIYFLSYIPLGLFNVTVSYPVLLVASVLWLIMAFGVIIGLIVMVVVFLRKKHKGARLFVAAILPFLISYIMKLFNADILIYTGLWAIILLSWELFARYKNLQIEHARVALEKEEARVRLVAEQNEILEKQVEERTAKLQQSLTELRQAQSQLIQSEKMASLGELTAGIAHEIQNPLNFVSNFSDISIELLDEMEEELDKGAIKEAKAISGDVKQNLEKIVHHGRRADSIVKGMLQHSGASSGQKEPTDINKLADDYLRLAYHGLRSKDKSFNAELITCFDKSLPLLSVIRQDMGRVLLNLFANAFYATREKEKNVQTIPGNTGNPYRPKVTVTTLQHEGFVEIIIEDNATGIPDAYKDKIFQPFFTTKPAGEGTGLGLSLSYEIVTKIHGGRLTVISKDGEGARLSIQLPK